MLAFSVFVYLFSINSMSSHFDSSYRSTYGSYGPNDMYDGGTFDLESWSCELVGFPVSHDNSELLKRHCKLEKASRWVTLFLFVFSLIQLAVVVWAFRGDHPVFKRRVPRRKSWHSDYGL